MEFCYKFYRNIEFQTILFGLLLSFSALNGAQSDDCNYEAQSDDCNYYQNTEAGKTYYVYNSEYPNYYKGKHHCTWIINSSFDVKINCSVQITGCQNTLSIKYANSKTLDVCNNLNNDTFFEIPGKNLIIITFDSECTSEGRFICDIRTSNDYCKCGQKKTTRIVGGKETGINEYPMMAGIISVEKRMIICGCTIINLKYVITAAHCIHNKTIDDIGVVVGEHDTTTGSDTNVTRVFRLKYYIIHPKYENDKNSKNDVAVCRIDGEIKYSAEVGPVCLPFQHKEESFDGDIVIALGWGLLEFGGSKSTTLQEVDLNVIPLEKCKNYSDVNDSNICTYTKGKDTCQMDSGGPLLWQDPKTNNLVLIGIISSGFGCASENPAISMRVGAFVDWIKSVTPDAQYCKIE